MQNYTIIYFIFFILLLIITSVLLFHYVLMKWKCVDGNCEKVIGGDYSDYNKCLQKCSPQELKNNKIQENKGWDCINSICRESEDEIGMYKTKSDCESRCPEVRYVRYEVPTYVSSYPRFIYPHLFQHYRRRHRSHDRHRRHRSRD